jgi:hypothetical protein
MGKKLRLDVIKMATEVIDKEKDKIMIISAHSLWIRKVIAIVVFSYDLFCLNYPGRFLSACKLPHISPAGQSTRVLCIVVCSKSVVPAIAFAKIWQYVVVLMEHIPYLKVIAVLTHYRGKLVRDGVQFQQVRGPFVLGEAGRATQNIGGRRFRDDSIAIEEFIKPCNCV